MPDEQAPAEEQDIQPTQDESGGIDWRKRYEDLRPQYDRVQNEHSRYQDPEQREQILQEWGYEFGEAQDEHIDPTERLRSELRAEFQEELTQRDQALRNERAILHAQEFAEQKLNDLGIKNTKARDWIETKATNMPALQDEEGWIIPDIESAYAEYVDLINEEKKTWGDKKSGNTVVASEGHDNTGVPSWRNEQDPDRRREMRMQWALEQVQARTQ